MKVYSIQDDNPRTPECDACLSHHPNAATYKHESGRVLRLFNGSTESITGTPHPHIDTSLLSLVITDTPTALNELTEAQLIALCEAELAKPHEGKEMLINRTAALVLLSSLFATDEAL